jgi:uncharacterized membrane protein YsdA (DUF1294 family)
VKATRAKPRSPARTRAKAAPALAPFKPVAWTLGGGVVFLFTAAWLLDFIPVWIPVAYLGMSILAFATYGLDKAKAERGTWRTPEATLHLLDFLGGWPGGLAAQQTFRHKTRKIPFQVVFWVIVTIHAGAWAWMVKADQLPALKRLFKVRMPQTELHELHHRGRISHAPTIPNFC